MQETHFFNHSIQKPRLKRYTRSKYYVHQQRPIQQSDCCRRVDFNVNFLELGWDKWIIFPKMFNAHICTGDCTIPLRSIRKRVLHIGAGHVKAKLVNTSLITTSATNHAQIMSILEYKHPEMNKQMTKCVSTKLRPLTVIFLNEHGQIKSKQYEDMIVDECGCR